MLRRPPQRQKRAIRRRTGGPVGLGVIVAVLLAQLLVIGGGVLADPDTSPATALRPDLTKGYGETDNSTLHRRRGPRHQQGARSRRNPGGLQEPRSPQQPRSNLRLLSYNIQWGMSADGVRDLDRIVAQLHRIGADIVVLNEVDVNWRRSGNVDQHRYLGRHGGYEYSYFGEALTRWASGNFRRSRYGNMLLSRHPIEWVETLPLPVGVGREPRSAVVARLNVDGTPWIVVGTHLGLHEGDRLRQTTALKIAAQRAVGDEKDAQSVPVVIMGDFNARPDGPEIAQLLDPAGSPPRLVDAFGVGGRGPGYTFPLPRPYARIDYIFLSSFLADAVVRAAAWPVPGSDHLPVVVDIDRSKIPGSEGPPDTSCQFPPRGIR